MARRLWGVVMVDGGLGFTTKHLYESCPGKHEILNI